MQYQEILKQRYSCRTYANRPVEREKIAACMEAGRIAPSGCNVQPWMFIAVDEAQRRSAVADALTSPPDIGINGFVHDIPAFIVVLKHPPRRPLNEKQKKILSQFDHDEINIGIAAQQICLAATDMGLGSVMLGWMDEGAIRKALDVPEEISPVLAIGLGYPKTERIKQPGRYGVEQVCRWNSYHGEDAGNC